LTGSWLLRVYSLPKYGVVPASLLDHLAAAAPNFDRWAKTVVQDSAVRCVWDEDHMIEATRGWINKMRGKA
jgi:glutathione S-transferase